MRIQSPTIDLNFVDQTVEELGRNPDAVIPILQALQGHYRYLPREALERVCHITQITPAAITGVSTFYTQFRHRPVGKHLISVCHGTACHVKGAELVQDSLQHHLHLKNGADTDPTGRFTVQKVACLGCCTLAPVVQIDELTYGNVRSHMVPELLADFLNQEDENRTTTAPAPFLPGAQTRAEIRVGLGSCCQAQGSAKVQQAIQRTLAELGTGATVKNVGCIGMCHQTPLVELVLPGQATNTLYSKVNPERARAIVLDHFQPQGLLRKVRYTVSDWLEHLLTNDHRAGGLARYALSVRDEPICAFLGPQVRLATEYNGQIDPLDLDEYRQYEGFQALERAMQLPPEEIIAEIQASGLRGRGGAGFPTGVKWGRVRAAAGAPKYIICNGDEGDPGAFMDRMILESFPYRVIEGMIIAARAVGAREGFFYIRAEYPLAVDRVRQALEHCQQRGILSAEPGSSGAPLCLKIKEGAGAFICGEETALLASIEGHRGMPRLRPPFPAECGLWGQPTLVNNVESYALVPWIVRHGAAAFAALGTEKSKGTKVFALAGRIRRGGLIEVPMGITIRQIVEEIGGGVLEGRTFKAVQVGGPSGGCIPAALADTPVDYEALTHVGAIMGSGGLVVLDDLDCMVDIARYFLRFTQNQSCGKCTFCRIGTRRMLDLLDRICAGHGKPQDLQNLEDLSRQVGAGSLCGLGKTAPNPVLTTLRYFRDEYEAHLAGRCPAGKCKDLIKYRITTDCIGCTLCAQRCPADAIAMTPYAQHRIDLDKCTRCDTCRVVCPTNAVVVE